MLIRMTVFIVCIIISLDAYSATIYLMRHAEKLSGEDPELSAVGKQRAQQLAYLLQKVNITHIFSTEYKRTIQTAEPLAEMTGRKIQFYNPRQLKKFAERLRHLNASVLVIGHSNTTSELTQLLSNQPVKPLAENDYGDLFQVIIGTKNSSLQHAMVEIH